MSTAVSSSDEYIDWTPARAATFQDILHTFLAKNPGESLETIAERAGVSVEFVQGLR